MGATRSRERIAACALLCLLAWQLHVLSTSTGSSRELLLRALDPRAGEDESLPVEVFEAVALVSAESAALEGRLRLSPPLRADTLMFQRSTEALYPLRLSDQAPIVLARPSERAVSGCTELRRARHVGLYDCRHRD